MISTCINCSVCRMQWLGWWLTIVLLSGCRGDGWADLDLPELHVPFYFRNNPHIAQQCRQDKDCPHKVTVYLA